MRNINFICEYCKNCFISEKVCKNRIPRFCSKTCYGKSIAKIKECLSCKKSFYNYNNMYFCSMKCSGNYKKGKPLSISHIKSLSISKKGKPQPQINTPEVREKISKALTGKPQIWNRGENHPNWKNGLTDLNHKVRNSLEYTLWRRKIQKRDNYICDICNKRGGKIHIDHIKPFSIIMRENNIKSYEEAVKCDLLWDINNGRVLCRACHLKTDTWGGRINK